MERPNEHLDLNANDICKIIKACSSHGVTEFSCQSLTISFEAREKELTENELPSSKVIEEAPENSEQELKALREEELLQKEFELSIMEIENPSEYEDLMASGILEDTVNSIIEEEKED